ncbi:ATP-binding cassette domain-containing protein [Microbacterium sp. SORGH_AS_0344]|uniref:ATP-binding cassette domain-containing protein n=1 Tax=Microbacterium sp. SORGH_AS_0344 TaxID=3041767 RepID=UPI00278158E3|nr:ATP-binding cassette domain-containing protein [Microbacterium sp. SORGH_AS_0344]MDQ1085312.1 ABC-type glutathione transport system ATPase component [Microbacterium sp. SORGH_AS_0344]
MTAPVLEVTGLEVVFDVGGEDVVAVSGLDLTVGRGEIVALVGESGSGKSVSALALVGLLPERARACAAPRCSGASTSSRSMRTA